jgi:YebC/PmpR family DNA-binding regulatory protein
MYMAGHSKWANIKHKKGKADAARGTIFTKLAKAITVAAKSGGDPEMNFALRVAIDLAKAENMPKDNIERAIKRGTGKDTDAAEIVTIVYEGYGPGGVAVLVECLTDNTNRAVSEVKHAFSKHGGSMGTAGSVQWQFDHCTVVMCTKEAQATIADWDLFELAPIDQGASDILATDDGIEIRGPKENFKRILTVVHNAGIDPEVASLMWVARDTLSVDADTSEQIQRLVAVLDELDDVHAVYTNEG